MTTAKVRRPGVGDVAAMRRLNALFGRAFGDAASYAGLGVREDVMHFDIAVPKATL